MSCPSYSLHNAGPNHGVVRTNQRGGHVGAGRVDRHNLYSVYARWGEDLSNVTNAQNTMHYARGTPGSHVIVRVEKGQSVPHETLKDAATGTLWLSD